MNLEDMSKPELILLLRQFDEKTDEAEKPYHPDSLVAMSLASPAEARAIARNMTPWYTKVILTCAFGFVFFCIAFVLMI